ncbi:MAG: protoporphyrinogen oxidase HemJ [Gammaproteobacteria bacterium]|nr:protoporphyrinogen oxidase HemJ [Gammaproteobacteria bacterium]
MAWILALHIIFMVAWFAGLFYLPRLFVYHTQCTDQPGQTRFKIMERKLFWMIMTPAGILTTIFGFWELTFKPELWQHTFFIVKLGLVFLLWVYHLYCGHLVQVFKRNQNRFSEKFYRIFNEVPTLLLIGIIIMAIVKPNL